MIETVQTKNETSFKLPDHLFLGRLLVEIQLESVDSYKKELYGLSKDSVIALPELSNEKVPYRMGKILKKAQDAFGPAFERRYGSMEVLPEIGDTIIWVPMQSFKLDPAGKFHLVSDESIVAFYKNSDNNIQKKGE